MEPTKVIKATIWEDGDVTEMARLQMNGANITQSDIASIQRKIFDLSSDTPGTALETTAPAVATVVFDTLQTSRWTKDNTGYNFRDRVAAASFTTGGQTYRVEYRFTGDSGEVFWLVFEHPAQSVRSS